MSTETVARRYARALYEEAEAQDLVDEIDEDVAFLRASLENSRELVRFFESPLIRREKKEAVVDRLFADHVHPLTQRLLQMLIRKQREEVTPGLPDAYRSLRDEREGVVEARVRTAVPLDENERAALAEQLESITGRTVRLSLSEDPDLIGGLVVRIGDTVYDGSVEHQLQELGQRFHSRSLATLTNGAGPDDADSSGTDAAG